MQITIWVSEIQ